MIRGLIREVRAWTWERIWHEAWNLFKFGIVGMTSLGINVMMYALFSRVLWVDGPKTLESVLSVLISAVFNFSMHYLWTFKAEGFGVRMLMRYVAVVVVGSSIHGTLFYIGHEVFGWYDLLVQVGAAFILATISYFLHRRFTFKYHYGDATVTIEHTHIEITEDAKK